jgi:signal transduction histidine kinase
LRRRNGRRADGSLQALNASNDSWFTQRWNAALASFDPDEALAASSPLAIALLGATLTAVFVIVGVVEPFASAARATATGACICLALTGSALTYIAHRHRCRGPVGSWCTLLDNGFYTASFAVAAVSTSPSFGIAFAVIQTVSLLGFTLRLYGFSLVLATVICAPTLVLVLVMRPAAPVTLILLACCAMSLLMMVNTTKRRELIAGTRRLEQALGATDQVLDVAMQRALTMTLLNLGNFVHELRNTQTAARLNLEFLDPERLSEPQRGAALDALQAVRTQQALLDQTLEELRRQAEPRTRHSFEIAESLERSLQARTAGLQIEYTPPPSAFEVRGESAHFATVIRNLLRNAAQANAARVTVRANIDNGGRAISIDVIDDGPGMSGAQIARLFRPFESSGRPAGTGLGLYLCRRYIELMHGEISVESELGKGARFRIRLPGRAIEAPQIVTTSRPAVPIGGTAR